MAKHSADYQSRIKFVCVSWLFKTGGTSELCIKKANPDWKPKTALEVNASPVATALIKDFYLMGLEEQLCYVIGARIELNVSDMNHLNTVLGDLNPEELY